MTRRDCCRLLGGAAAAQTAPAAANPPNILLILTDDQGWWDLGSHGNRDIETPNLDKLAAESVEFRRFYVSPVCAPTRASLLTGRHYLRTGVYNTRFGGDNMRAEENTLPEVLRRRGYRTAMSGKWHLGRYRHTDPLSQGFDDALWQVEGHLERYYYADQLLYNRRPVATRGYITRLLTERTLQFLSAPSKQPFFFYLAYNAPHEPRIVDTPYVEKYLKKGLPLREAETYGMITCLDEEIGKVLAQLDRSGLRDNTLVLFMSDNGGVSRHFRAGLRGNKGTAYEGGVRSPFFARLPGRFPAGAKVDAMAAHIDLMPTLCALTGAAVPDAPPVDGKNILPLLEKGGGESPHEYLYHIWDRHRPSLKSAWSISGRRYKLVGSELFDLENDPGENKNLAAEKPDIAADLRRRFEDWLRDVTAGQTFEPPPILVGGEEDPVEIQASWAHIDGTHVTWSPPGGGRTQGPLPLGDPPPGAAINYTFSGYDWDTIDGWRKPGEQARWRLDVLRPGRYEVAVSYGCDAADAGGKFRIRVGAAALDGVVEATAGRNVFWERAAGAVELAKGQQWLSVEVVTAPGRELMSLNRIWLRRAPPAGAMLK